MMMHMLHDVLTIMRLCDLHPLDFFLNRFRFSPSRYMSVNICGHIFLLGHNCFTFVQLIIARLRNIIRPFFETTERPGHLVYRDSYFALPISKLRVFVNSIWILLGRDCFWQLREYWIHKWHTTLSERSRPTSCELCTPFHGLDHRGDTTS